MPTLVLKCDFCFSTFSPEDSEKAAKHQAECVFNPEVKHCYTCKHKEDHYRMDLCGVKSPHFQDWMHDDENPCPLWEGKSND